MKWMMIFLLSLSFNAFAEEACGPEDQNCTQQEKELTEKVEKDQFSEQEVGQALDQTEKTLGNIGRDIAGSFEEE